MLDPVTTSAALGALAYVAKPLAKQVEDFVAAISGHPEESLGTILGSIGARRWANLDKVADKAHFILLNLDLKPREVPLNVLQPALEGASVQEDTFLQEVWANLLANAADPRKLNEVAPSFPAILKELGPREVRLLDALGDVLQGKGPAPFTQVNLMWIYDRLIQSVGDTAAEAQGVHTAEIQKYLVSFDILRKQQLVNVVAQPQPIRYDPTRVPAGRMPKEIKLQPSNLECLYLTALGRSFLAVCKAPPAKS
jgi:hypothetical protein